MLTHLTSTGSLFAAAGISMAIWISLALARISPHDISFFFLLAFQLSQCQSSGVYDEPFIYKKRGEREERKHKFDDDRFLGVKREILTPSGVRRAIWTYL
ncbi:hypothetical protein QBC46DRAFT_78176 [Diplogelasinospora grovesii]|uniref:Uncharacterized protein n=1 Tax=Diplogelasinospora grovesii TaxID=303347 RepID=A0AAN6S736_9PEZI|nr:hypothetical protein QBC46DRAFT_78176 [Diplogelasinospora grovesii]